MKRILLGLMVFVAVGCVPCSARTVEEAIGICQCDVLAAKTCRAGCDPEHRAECERECVKTWCE